MDTTTSVDRLIGQRLAQTRLQAGLTLRELAARLGWDHSTLSSYETGRRSLNIARLIAVAQELGHSPASFLVMAREQMQPPQFQDLNHTFFVATVMGRPLETFYASDIYSRLSDRQRRILAIIRAQGESSTSDITAGFGGAVTQRSIQRDIKELLAVGLIRAVGGSHSTRYRLFDNAPQHPPLPL